MSTSALAACSLVQEINVSETVSVNFSICACVQETKEPGGLFMGRE